MPSRKRKRKRESTRSSSGGGAAPQRSRKRAKPREEEEEEAAGKGGGHPTPLPAHAAAVAAARALIPILRAETRRAVGDAGHGYVHGATRCTGLTKRLAARAMPHLPSRAALARPKGRFARTRFGGSSAATGRRVDAEVYHLVECVRYAPEDVTGGRVPPAGGTAHRPPPPPAPPTDDDDEAGAKKKKPRKRAPPAPTNWTCATCPLEGARYARARPAWHRWTLMYLRDVARKGMTLVASQVPVAEPTRACATELDDLAVDAHGRALVVVERKTGYEDVAGRPRAPGRRNRVLLRGASGVEHDLWNTEHTLHTLQAAVGAEMLAASVEGAARRARARGAAAVEAAEDAPPVRAGGVVVYVSGKSAAPTRDPDAALECVWRWGGAVGADVARALLPAL